MEDEENQKPIAVFYAYDEYNVSLYAHVTQYACLVDDILNLLRSKDKYGTNYTSAEEAIEKIREEVLDLVGSYDIPRD